MSALTFEWMPTETETTTSVLVKGPENQSREEEFRLALDRYIANHNAQQKRRSHVVSSVVGISRRLLTAGREIWSFSRSMDRDWRGDPASKGRYGPVGRHLDDTIGGTARRPHRDPSANMTYLRARSPDLAEFRFSPSGNWTNNLGIMYATGTGVSQDYVKAARWYREAAENGDANAQYNLGAMHYHGRGVSLDYGEAARWFRKAAEQHDADAQSILDYLDKNGAGPPPDTTEVELRQAQEQATTDIAAEGSNHVTGWFTKLREWLVARHRRHRTYWTPKTQLKQHKPENLASFGVAEG